MAAGLSSWNRSSSWLAKGRLGRARSCRRVGEGGWTRMMKTSKGAKRATARERYIRQRRDRFLRLVPCANGEAAQAIAKLAAVVAIVVDAVDKKEEGKREEREGAGA